MSKCQTTLNIAMASAMALALTACDKAGTPEANPSAQASGALPALPTAVPLQPGAATAMAPAPPAQALPVQQRVRVARVQNRSDAYAYLDRAQGVTQAIGDAPPDYSYDDGGVTPWVWQTSQGDRRYAEPVEGGYRYYYYQSGSDTPYLVRDPQYSYAYSGPQLVAVYDQRGGLLPSDAYERRADFASRYYDRANYLYRLSREREHRGVIAANWAARRAEIAASRAQWAQDLAQQEQWRAYHQAHEAQERAHWQDESERRAAQAQRFAQWQHEGFRSPPPQPVNYAPPPSQPRYSSWMPSWLGGDRQARQDAQRRQALQQQQQLQQQQREQARRQQDQQAAIQRTQRQIAAQQAQQRARQQQITQEQGRLSQQQARLRVAHQQSVQRQAEQQRKAAREQQARAVAEAKAHAAQDARAQAWQRTAQQHAAQQQKQARLRQMQQDRARQQAAQHQAAQAQREAAAARRQAQQAQHQAQAAAKRQEAQARAAAQRAAHAQRPHPQGDDRHPG